MQSAIVRLAMDDDVSAIFGDLSAAAAVLALTLVTMGLVSVRLERISRRVAPPHSALAPPAEEKVAESAPAALGNAEPADIPIIAEWKLPLFPAGSTQPLASAEELRAIAAIRRAARRELAAVRSPEVSSDVRILRFLRGYATVAEALAQYLAMLAWRAEHKLDDVRDAVLGLPLQMDALPHGAALAAAYPCTLSVGRTREGHFVSCDAIGRADVARIFRELGEGRTEAWFLHFFELRALLLDEASVKAGMLLQTIQLKDLDGLSLAVLRSADGRRGLALVRRVLATATRYYPESALTLWIINAPSFFAITWRFLSAVLPARTVTKVRILGANYLPAIRASGQIDEELLRAMGYVEPAALAGGRGQPAASVGAGAPATAAADGDGVGAARDSSNGGPLSGEAAGAVAYVALSDGGSHSRAAMR